MTTHPQTGSLELWLKVVREIIGQPTETLSLLDLCCNECTATASLKWDHHVAVDVVDWPTRKRVDSFFLRDAVAFLADEGGLSGYGDGRFDVCICSDGIEHLTKQNGLKLLTEVPRVARLSILFTPLGPYMLDPTATHPDAHKSAWLPEELEALGWQTKSFPAWHPTLNVGAFFAWKNGSPL